MHAANHADEFTAVYECPDDGMPVDQWPPTDADELAALDDHMDDLERQWMLDNGFDPFGNETPDEFLDRVIGVCWQSASGSQFAADQPA